MWALLVFIILVVVVKEILDEVHFRDHVFPKVKPIPASICDKLIKGALGITLDELEVSRVIDHMEYGPIHVIKSNYALRKIGLCVFSSMALVTQIKDKASFMSKAAWVVILSEDIDLDSSIGKWVIGHELGHLENKDLFHQTESRFEDLMQEVRADLYAAKYSGVSKITGAFSIPVAIWESPLPRLAAIINIITLVPRVLAVLFMK